MTDEEKSKELTRSSFAAQMAMLGYEPNGNPKDMVEVVRCKDCVFRDNRDGMCEHVLQIRDPDWYCADGERK